MQAIIDPVAHNYTDKNRYLLQAFIHPDIDTDRESCIKLQIWTIIDAGIY